MTEDTWKIEGDGFTVTANRCHIRGAAAGEDARFAFIYPDLDARVRRLTLDCERFEAGLAMILQAGDH